MEKLKTIVYLWFLWFGFMIVYILIKLALLHFFQIPERVSFSFSDQNKWYISWIIGVALIPFVEELTFRLSLNFKPFYLAISLSCISYFIICEITQSHYYQIEGLLVKLIPSITIAIIIFVIFSTKAINVFLKGFWIKNSRVIIYISIISFTIFHFGMVKTATLTQLILLPILFSPQLLIGISSSYLRQTCGILYSIIYHSMVNVLPFSILFIN